MFVVGFPILSSTSIMYVSWYWDSLNTKVLYFFFFCFFIYISIRFTIYNRVYGDPSSLRWSNISFRYNKLQINCWWREYLQCFSCGFCVISEGGRVGVPTILQLSIHPSYYHHRLAFSINHYWNLFGSFWVCTCVWVYVCGWVYLLSYPQLQMLLTSAIV